MKVGLIFLIIGIFFSVVLAYQLSNFSPFNLEKIQDLIISEGITFDQGDKIDTLIKEKVISSSVFEYLSDTSYIVFGLLNAVVISIFSFIHIVVDKLFFKTYFESPSYFKAIRRAFLLGLSLSLVIYMRLLKIELSNILLIPITALIFEIIISSLETKKIKKI